MLDIENLSPEIEYINQWVSLNLGVNELNVDKVKQLSLGLSFNGTF